jgi:hypothetical protein
MGNDMALDLSGTTLNYTVARKPVNSVDFTKKYIEKNL